MCVLGHSEAQSKSQINPLARFRLLGKGTQARVSRGVWVQTRFCSRKQGRKVTCGSFVIGDAAGKLPCALLHPEKHTGLNSTSSARCTKILCPGTDRAHLT